MESDAEVCLCFHVTKRKVVSYCKRENPPVASLISECLGAGTGCGWCVPYLKRLHQQVQDNVHDPDLPLDPQTYAEKRKQYRSSGKRDA